MPALKVEPTPATYGFRTRALVLQATGSAEAGLKAPLTAPVAWCRRVPQVRLAGNTWPRVFGDVRASIEVRNGAVAELAEKSTDIGDLFQRARTVDRVSNQHLDAVEIVLNIGEACAHGTGDNVGRVQLHGLGQPGTVACNAAG